MVDLSQLQKIKTEAEIVAEGERDGAIRYLQSTDWYVIRQVETGAPMPDAVREQRAAARLIITPQ